MKDDFKYFSSRAIEERAAALSSLDPRVRARHLEFADAYLFRVHELEAAEKRLLETCVNARFERLRRTAA